MKYYIDIEESVKKVYTYTIEVEDEGEGNMIADSVERCMSDAIHPDDMSGAFYEMGTEILEICEGPEDAEYEVVDAGIVEEEE